MDKKTKILIGVFICGLIISIFLTYKNAFIDRDFEIIKASSNE
jgi:hypothetical protein